MRLRSITLTNVRRFADRTVALDGLGDGLNLVAAPNEAGKSTFFEALQALVCTPHRSSAAEARALQPYAGGAPEVAAEVEVGGVGYLVAKRWLQRPFARVSERATGRVLHQDDEAERWIARHLAGGGPADLLWVRQGMLGLEPEGRGPAEKTEQERLARIRRDLLSSVASELDAVTGGRRLDAIAGRTQAALAELATATGKPKAGGRWADAEKEAAALRSELDLLDGQCAALAAALAERAGVRRDLATAADPAAARERADAIRAAEGALAAARLHASELAAAREALRAANLERDAAAEALAAHDRATAGRAGAEADAAAAREAVALAEAAHAAAVERERTALEARDTARSAHATAAAALDVATRAARANEAAARAAALDATLDRVDGLMQEIKTARAEAREAGVSDADVAAGRTAAAALDRARARLEAGAVSVSVAYLPGVRERVSVDGMPLEDGAFVACTSPTTLDLPGLGRLILEPGGDAAEAARAAAEADAALRAVLAPAGVPDVAALAARATSRAEAEARALRAGATLAGLAPCGADALASERERLRGAAADADPDAPDPATSAAAEADARAALSGTESAFDAARTERLLAAQAESGARDRLAGAERVLMDASSTAEALPARSALTAGHDALRAAADAAERAVDDRARAMPDVPEAAASLATARAADEAVETRLHELEKRDERLTSLISTRAGEAVEERRDEVAGRLEEAEARAAGYAAEARALSRLHAALATARADARDRYLAPVTAELAPLLARLLDGAELRLDPKRLVPEAMARGSLAEEIADLSGGTREQIAILTRLAFARLLVRTGRAVPVILDDPLVYADDSRFARMLDALGAVAADVQVIVLTCRERSFASLAAHRPVLEERNDPRLVAQT